MHMQVYLGQPFNLIIGLPALSFESKTFKLKIFHINIIHIFLLHFKLQMIRN